MTASRRGHCHPRFLGRLVGLLAGTGMALCPAQAEGVYEAGAWRSLRSGVAEYKAGRCGPALPLLTDAAMALPQVAQAETLRAICYFVEGRFDEARRAGLEARRLTNDTGAALALAYAQLKLSRLAEARALLEETAALAPLDPRVHLLRAEAARAAGQRPLAQRLTQQALALMEDDGPLREFDSRDDRGLRRAFEADRVHRRAWQSLQQAEAAPGPAAWRRARAQFEAAFGRGHAVIGKVLRRQAMAEGLGSPARIELLRQALALSSRALGRDHPLSARLWQDLGESYLEAARPEQALAMFSAAVAARDSVARGGEVDVLDALSGLASAAKAVDLPLMAEAALQRRARLAREQLGPLSAKTQQARLDLAEHYDDLGALPRADRLVREVETDLLSMDRSDEPYDRYFLWQGLALLLDRWGEDARARSLRAREQVPDDGDGPAARRLIRHGQVLDLARADRHAEALVELRALIEDTALRDGADSTRVFELESLQLTLMSSVSPPQETLAFARQRRERLIQRATSRLDERVAIERRILWLTDDPGERAETQRWLQAVALAGDIRERLRGEIHGSLAASLPESRRAARVLHGKLGVALDERARAQLAGSDPEVRKAYAVKSEHIHRRLVADLLRHRRLGEADEALRRMRTDELGAPADGGERCLPAECQALGQWRGLARRWLADERRLGRDTPAGRALRAGWDEAGERLERALADGTAAAPPAATAGPRALVEHLPAGTVLVRYLRVDRRLWLWAQLAGPKPAGNAHFLKEIDLGTTELDSLVAELRRHLTHPRSDPRALQRQLQAAYGLLVSPMQAWLDQATAGVAVPRLLVVPDEALLMLPFAALHDGQRHLLERYAIATLSDAARERLDLAPTLRRQAAFGVTQEHHRLRELPYVGVELEAVAGLLEGPPARLDAAFTRTALDATLQANRGGAPDRTPIVHLASHFLFGVAENERNGLLLGDGSMLPLGELRSLDFSGTELLTLSACQTAEARGTLRNRWLEVDGFAQLALKNGAHAVLATLWRANDLATSILMRRFYALWGTPPAPGAAPRDKAQALRQAQLEVMRGEAEGQPLLTPRGHRLDASHPALWAPFTLLGNWR